MPNHLARGPPGLTGRIDLSVTRTCPSPLGRSDLRRLCMCTRPDRHSISTSAHALRDAALSLLFASGMLLLALLSAPPRLLKRRQPQNLRSATVGYVDVQVHLEDRKCV